MISEYNADTVGFNTGSACGIVNNAEVVEGSVDLAIDTTSFTVTDIPEDDNVYITVVAQGTLGAMAYGGVEVLNPASQVAMSFFLLLIS